MLHTFNRLLTAVLLLVMATSCVEEDWEAIEGPNGEGIQDEFSEELGSSAQELTGAPTCYGPHWCTRSAYPTYSWSGVAGAGYYRFVLFKYVNGSEVQVDGRNVYGLSTTSPQNPLQQNILYRWKVKGEGPSGYDPGPYCAGGVGNYFYYDPTCPWY